MRDYKKLTPILNTLTLNPSAVLRYDLYADALVWSDEVPLVENSDRFLGVELRGIWHFRTSLILGQPKERFRPAWDEARRCFPNWPGLDPKRRDPSLAATLQMMQEEARNKSEYTEDRIEAELARKNVNV